MSVSDYPQWICAGCGSKYSKAYKGQLSTFHDPEPGERCGWCGSTTAMLTEPRDYGYPKQPEETMSEGMTPERRAEIEAILQMSHTRDDCDTRFEWRLLQALRDSVAEIDRLNKVVDQAVPIVREYARNNPKFDSVMGWGVQDPLGAHAWLEAAELQRRGR